VHRHVKAPVAAAMRMRISDHGTLEFCYTISLAMLLATSKFYLRYDTTSTPSYSARPSFSSLDFLALLILVFSLYIYSHTDFAMLPLSAGWQRVMWGVSVLLCVFFSYLMGFLGFCISLGNSIGTSCTDKSTLRAWRGLRSRKRRPWSRWGMS
jgi:hypothetical protein